LRIVYGRDLVCEYESSRGLCDVSWAGGNEDGFIPLCWRVSAAGPPPSTSGRIGSIPDGVVGSGELSLRPRAQPSRPGVPVRRFHALAWRGAWRGV